MRIIFSILVHEKLEVVLNQIENFIRFNKGSYIVLHLSSKFRIQIGKDIKILKSLKYVYINDVSLNTGFMDNSQFLCHFSNLDYLFKESIFFDYVCFHASNDMFVKEGLSAYIQQFDIGSECFSIYRKSNWIQGNQVLKDRQLLNCLMKSNIKHFDIKGSQIEGSFMNYTIYLSFLRIIKKYKLEKDLWLYSFLKQVLNLNPKLMVVFSRVFKGIFYGKEEVYFPTFMYNFSKTNCNPYVYINWNSKLKIEVLDVMNIVNNHDIILNNCTSTKYFAVKRIERDLNDPIRIFINSIN